MKINDLPKWLLFACIMIMVISNLFIINKKKKENKMDNRFRDFFISWNYYVGWTGTFLLCIAILFVPLIFKQCYCDSCYSVKSAVYIIPAIILFYLLIIVELRSIRKKFAKESTEVSK